MREKLVSAPGSQQGSQSPHGDETIGWPVTFKHMDTDRSP